MITIENLNENRELDLEAAADLRGGMDIGQYVETLLSSIEENHYAIGTVDFATVASNGSTAVSQGNTITNVIGSMSFTVAELLG